MAASTKKTPAPGAVTTGESADTVRVAVRVRPFNEREKALNAQRVVFMNGESTTITDPHSPDKSYTFSFDFSYDSFESTDPNYTSQEKVFEDLGLSIVETAWSGFNCSVFAYGQTGAGKSYSMMGYGNDKGLIPRCCEELFNRINANTDPNNTFTVEVAYLEIYNEQIRDLLSSDVRKSGSSLTIRENKAVGVYVEDLSKILVRSFEGIEQAIVDGNRCRSVAKTKMNDTSSRGHSVFTIYFTRSSMVAGMKDTITSKIDLIDLAGSERQSQTEAEGDRLKEACNINKSLSALGNVISALADRSKGKNKFVPYRDSVLTRLLANSLGGNSKTIMIAALSPASANYDETLSTLKYADRAKRIVNKAVKNNAGKDATVSALMAEVERLKALLGGGGGGGADGLGGEDSDEMRERLLANEKLIQELTLSVEQREARTAEITRLREAALEDMGISIGELSSAFGVDKSIPHLVNLNADPLMSENLLYFLRDGITRIGKETAENKQDIVLSGFTIAPEHAMIKITADKSSIMLIPIEGARTFVNGVQITAPAPLKTGTRIILGTSHIFRFNNPLEIAALRAEREARGAKPEEEDHTADWAFAMKELAMARGLNEAVDPNSETGLILRLVEETDEANDMCELLKKKMIFSVELHNNEKTKKREVAIRATDLLTDSTKIWSVEKFESRLERMQTLVEEYSRTGNYNVNTEDDPFNDPPSDQLIGNANLPLASLLETGVISQWVPIRTGRYDEKKGEILIGMKVAEGKYGPSVMNQDINVTVSLGGIRDLVSEFNCGLFVKFTFPEAGAEQVTERVTGPTNTPQFHYKESFGLSYSEEFVTYLKHTNLLFEVWGHENADARNPDVLIEKVKEQDEELKVLRKHFEIINRQQADELVSVKRRLEEVEKNAYALIKNEVLEYQAKKAKLEAALRALRHALPTFQAQLTHLLESGKLGELEAVANLK